ncbi:hypothetical protein [Pseudomonas sp. PS01301]|uniref:hypothetical protein n=1 Tax=Pseudomonas sp. PS01301 TaxID=2991437 RepID=UPI00249CDE69|nr:hypothetical protein [Pseudomonas sp. PS01301]
MKVQEYLNKTLFTVAAKAGARQALAEAVAEFQARQQRSSPLAQAQTLATDRK